MTTKSRDINLNITIDVATHFSKYPAGRYRSDGPFSGQAFREDFLLKALRENFTVNNETVTPDVLVSLDGVVGYNSSFLEEAFGGLIRVEKMQIEVLNKRLNFRADDKPNLITEIWGYITDAAACLRLGDFETPKAVSERLLQVAGEGSLGLQDLQRALEERDAQVAAWCLSQAKTADQKAKTLAAESNKFRGGDSFGFRRLCEQIEYCEGQVEAWRAVAERLGVAE